MKAKDLAEKLLKHPEFEVKASITYYPDVSVFNVDDVEDAGYSDRVVMLGLSDAP